MESHGKRTDGGETTSRTDAELRLMSAVAAATRNAGSQAELRAAARELVQQLRLEKEPPEKVLLRIKRVLADAGLRPSYSLAVAESQPLSAEAAVYRDVIAWSIRHYYDERGV